MKLVAAGPMPHLFGNTGTFPSRKVCSADYMGVWMVSTFSAVLFLCNTGYSSRYSCWVSPRTVTLIFTDQFNSHSATLLKYFAISMPVVHNHPLPITSTSEGALPPSQVVLKQQRITAQTARIQLQSQEVCISILNTYLTKHFIGNSALDYLFQIAISSAIPS